MLTIQNYVKAASLEEAYELNQKKSSRIIGGMLWLKMSHMRVQTAIDLSGLGLDFIEEDENELPDLGQWRRFASWSFMRA